MSRYRVEALPSVARDIETAFEWYEGEQDGLGLEFLEELRATFENILDGPFKYENLKIGIRRAFTKRFPYAVYFSVEGEIILIVAVLHTARDPAEWKRRVD